MRDPDGASPITKASSTDSRSTVKPRDPPSKIRHMYIRLPPSCVPAGHPCRYAPTVNLFGTRTLTSDRVQRSGYHAGESNPCLDRLWRIVFTLPWVSPHAEP